MGRPADFDWRPLGLSTDPVPGDPTRIAEEAQHLSSVAATITSQVAALRKIAADGVEVGKHADVIRSSASDLASQLDKIVGRYQKVAAALTGWIPDLEQAQSMSVQALNQAEGPYRQLNQAVVLPSGTNLTAAQQQAIQDYHTAMNRATDELNAAKTLLHRATSLRDQSGSHTAHLINAASDDGMKDSWWDQWSWLISDICTGLEILATVAGVIAFILAQFVPGLDVLVDALVLGAFLATLAAAGGRFALALTGHGSWLDFGLDAFACLTFGLGRFIGAGARMVAENSELSAGRLMATELKNLALGGNKAAEIAKTADMMGQDVAAMADRLAPKLLKAAVTNDSELTGFAKVMANLGATSDEGEAFAKIFAISSRFAGSVADYAAAAKVALTITGVGAGVGSLTGLVGLVAGGIEFDGPFGPTPVNWHIPGLYNWYKNHLEIPTGAPG